MTNIFLSNVGVVFALICKMFVFKTPVYTYTRFSLLYGYSVVLLGGFVPKVEGLILRKDLPT